MIDDAATRVNASAGGATSDALEDHDRDLARRPCGSSRRRAERQSAVVHLERN